MTRTAQSGGGELTTAKSTTYDPTSGLPLTEETDAAGEKDCTVTEYATDTTGWILSLPKRVEKVSVGCDATPKRTGDPKTTDVVSDVRTSYDNQAHGKPPTKGDATKVERVIGYTGSTAQLQTVVAYHVRHARTCRRRARHQAAFGSRTPTTRPPRVVR